MSLQYLKKNINSAKLKKRIANRYLGLWKFWKSAGWCLFPMSGLCKIEAWVFWLAIYNKNNNNLNEFCTIIKSTEIKGKYLTCLIQKKNKLHWRYLDKSESERT